VALTISTSYASGTVNTASGTNITLSSGTAVSAWVGRLFVLNRSISGRGGQYRKITAVNSSTSITIQYAWRTSLDSGDPDYESLPQNGDAFHISHTWDDIDNGSDVVKVDAGFYRRADDLTISGNVTLFAENSTIDLGSLSPNNTGGELTFTDGNAGMVFGNYTESGYGERGCVLKFSDPGSSDSSGNINAFGDNSGNAGDFLCFASTIQVIGMADSRSYFARFYRGSQHIVRFVDCLIDGSFSGRYQGTRSMRLRNKHINQKTVFAVYTLIEPFGLDDENQIIDCDSIVYFRLDQLGTNTTITQVTGRNIAEAIVGLSYFNSNADPRTINLDNFDYDDSATYAISKIGTGNNQPDKRVNWRKGLTVNAFDGSALDGGGQIAVYDINDLEIANTTSGTGIYDPVLLTERFWDLPSTGTAGFSLTFASGTVLAPYELRLREYGFRFIVQSFNAESPITFNWFKQTNAFVTAADSSTALAVANPTTCNQIYDHAQATYALSGNMQYAELITTADGQSLRFDLAVTIDDSLTAESYDLANDAVSYSAVTNGTFVSILLGQNQTLDIIDGSAATGSWFIPANGTVTVNADTDLSSFTFANGGTLDNLSASNITVTVAAGQADNINISSPTTGGGAITLTVPATTVTLTDIIAGSEVRAYETDTSTQIAGVESVSTTSFVFPVTVAFDIEVLKRGYKPVNIRNNGVPSSDQTIKIDQVVDRGFRDVT
jgi:hypothetical protein